MMGACLGSSAPGSAGETPAGQASPAGQTALRPGLTPPSAPTAPPPRAIQRPTGAASPVAPAPGTAAPALARSPSPAALAPRGASPAATAGQTASPAASPVPPVAAPPPRQAPTVDPAREVFDPSSVRVSLQPVGSGFSQPLLVTQAGDGSDRLFILEKIGRVRLADGSVFLDIRDRVIAPPLMSYEREQGLLGLAFHPNFVENGYLYVHYNDLDGNHVISRFQTDGDGWPDPASETVLLTQEQLETNFNGGTIAFGPDGYLYIAMGTGGTAVDLQWQAQDLGSLMGKILRIDVDGGDPYGIPWDNPFVDVPDARAEVWAYGLRNPWRFAFDRATGDLYIGGPGEFQREWINFQAAETPPGVNFGWPILEGTICWRQQTCDTTGLDLPILEYETYEGGNCVVIGGNVYRGPSYPSLDGAYLFGDFCSGRIWAAGRDAAGVWGTAEVARLNGLISSFGEDEAGEVYVTDIQRGNVYRIVAR